MVTINPSFGRINLDAPVSAQAAPSKTNRDERGSVVHVAVSKVGEDHAQNILKKISDHPRRSGYLRLDGESTGNLSFSRRFAINPFRSAKGHVTGQALKGLFQAQGLDTRLLEAYLGLRGNKRLEMAELADIIDKTEKARHWPDNFNPGGVSHGEAYNDAIDHYNAENPLKQKQPRSEESGFIRPQNPRSGPGNADTHRNEGEFGIGSANPLVEEDHGDIDNSVNTKVWQKSNNLRLETIERPQNELNEARIIGKEAVQDFINGLAPGDNKLENLKELLVVLEGDLESQVPPPPRDAKVEMTRNNADLGNFLAAEIKQRLVANPQERNAIIDALKGEIILRGGKEWLQSQMRNKSE